jgi:hypothetical protein
MTNMMDDFFEGLSIRPVTRKLVENLILDLPVSPAQIRDFGVSALHYRLLQRMVWDVYGNNTVAPDDVDYERIVLKLREIIVEIDKVLGDSARLQTLIQENVSKIDIRIHANTTWDNLFANDKKSAEEK